MINELLEIKDIYGQERKSQISQDEGLLNREDMVKKEDVIVVLTDANYVKRMPITEFRSTTSSGPSVARGAPARRDPRGREHDP